MLKKCFEKLFGKRGTKMNLDKLRDRLISDEGVVYAVYLDHLGYPTMGVGHLITPDDPEYGLPVGTEVSYERVWNAFEEDLEFKIAEARRLYPEFDSWPGEVQEIMVNMMFNMGRTNLSGFRRMNAALARGDWQEAAREGRDSRWYRQVTNRAERLMTRMENIA